MHSRVLPIVCFTFKFACLSTMASAIAGVDHNHHSTHHQASHQEPTSQGDRKIEPPKVFLDKNPRIVWYQLNRLSNEQLLLVERGNDAPKFVPVHTAILIRGGMQTEHRIAALEALSELNKTEPAITIIDAAEKLEANAKQLPDTTQRLVNLVLRTPQSELEKLTDSVIPKLQSSNESVRQLALSLLTVAAPKQVIDLVEDSNELTKDWLTALSFVHSQTDLETFNSKLLGLAEHQSSSEIRVGAIEALQYLKQEQSRIFEQAAKWIDEEDALVRDAAIRLALTIPREARPSPTAAKLLQALIDKAEATAPARRTEPEFIALTQLAESLMVEVDIEQAQDYRSRLSEISVRVVSLHTIKEEMRYDRSYFAVEAGRPVQVVLHNDDLMPHNLVITTPGNLLAVAELGLAAGPKGGVEGKEYVPKSSMVLHATSMVQPIQSEKLTFTAPTEPGEYPYVCTFPQHAYRMYGVMVVVKDLDQWQRNPVVPEDPLGSNRPFVKSWKVADLTEDLERKLQGRTTEIGQKIVAEATCLQCHKIDNQGGNVGPSLNGSLSRLENDHTALLREILEPSHRIEPKYVVNVIITLDGRTITGIIVAEDSDSYSIVSNPESPTPEFILKEDVDELTVTAVSMMPKGLMDHFTEDEILELLAYVASLKPNE